MPELQPLSPFEQQVVDAARDGGVARVSNVAGLSPAEGAYNDPLKWLKDRQVRAALIYALATKSNPYWPVHAKGVRVEDALIVGALDFEAANVKCPLSLQRCWIPERIIFTHASVRSIDLSGSFVPMGIDADGVRADHDVLLAEGFLANGKVSLGNATLGGDLLCHGGSFVNDAGEALNADGVDVRGNISLGSGFRAKGEVRLLGANIRGVLSCNAGSFENTTDDALSADGVDVKGTIFLGSGFSARGGVRLPDAKVGGNLVCNAGSFEEGSFKKANKYALSADRIDIKGGVFLNKDRCAKEGFSAKGEVRLTGAQIGGDLGCNGGIFKNEPGVALKANGIHVAGGLFMEEGFSAIGTVDLQDAHVGALRDGALFDDESNAPAKLALDGFTYNAIHGPTDACKRLKWLQRESDPRFRPQPYEQLAGVLRRMGHERDARRISFEKQVALRKRGRLGLAGWLWSALLCVTIGYGYRLWLAFAWAIGLLLLGTVVAHYAHGLGNLRTDPDAPASVQTAGGGELDEYLHAVFYSLNATLPSPIANFSNEALWGRGLPWQLREQGQNDRWYWFFEAWFLLQRLLGWLLAGLMIAAAGGLIKKE